MRKYCINFCGKSAETCAFLMLLTLLFQGLSTNAQNDRRHWFFGNFAGLDFSSGSPVAASGPINTNEGCAVINNASGTLLFSSDGVNVYNRIGSTMPGYTSLWGDASTTQSALIIPQPGNDSIYYIFTGAAEVAFSRRRFTGISYSTVNMNLSGGLGEVIRANDTLLPYACEKICGIRNQNGVDYWVIVHKFESDQFYVYPVTAAGVGAPIIQSIGRYYFRGANPSNTIGYLKASKDGSHFAAVIDKVHNDTIDLFGFDACSGIIHDYQPIPYAGDGYGVCFSPSGQFLYVSSEAIGLPDDLWQFDITAPNIASTMVVLHHADSLVNFGAIQEGPDGKLYVAEAPRNYLGVINNPDLPGSLSNFNYSGFPLGAHTSAFGLPNFIEGTGAVTTSHLHDSIFTCLKPFVISMDPGAGSYRWSTGDSTSSISISSSGPYWVARTNACSSINVDSFYVSFADSLSAPDFPDSIICAGSALSYQVDASIYSGAIWNGTVNSFTFNISSPGAYFVVVNSTCGDLLDSFDIEYLSVPTTSPIADTTICEGVALGYHFIDTGFSQIRWNDTLIGNSFLPIDSGTYYLTAEALCGTFNDTFHVAYKSYKPELLRDTIVCDGLPVFFSFGDANFVNIRWNSSIFGNTYAAIDSGMHWLSAESPCGMYEDTFYVSYKPCDNDTPTLNIHATLNIPAAFTPNGDGNNDFFSIFASNISSYHIGIYSRWGQQVYESENLNELNQLNRGWDGSFKGVNQPADVYTFYINYTDNDGRFNSRKGNLTLIK